MNPSKENKFIIIIPVYNAVSYIRGCLESVIFQNYRNYEVCVMDDHSTDGTWEIINEVSDQYGFPFNLYRNEYRTGSALGNIVFATELFVVDSEDIICIVDGDDCLLGNSVLSDLNEVYQDVDVWMTYGQFVPKSGSYGAYCKEIPDTRTYRKGKEWLASHLRTYKKKIWDRIDDADLRDKNGEYYRVTGDTAVLYPLIEMCGHTHMRFVSKVNYQYNDRNPLNDMAINKEDQLRTEKEIKDKSCYEEL